MQITRTTKRSNHLSTPITNTEYGSPNGSISISNQNTQTIHTEIISLHPNVNQSMAILPKPIILNQEQIQSGSEREEGYYTSQQTYGYLNISDRQTYRISKYENKIRKHPVSLHKAKQISQFIIINNNKTIQSNSTNLNHRHSKSATDTALSITNASSSGSNSHNNRYNKNQSNSRNRRNISLTLKMVYQQQRSMIEENTKITRAKRSDKGGVVDLALPDIERTFYPIHYGNNNVNNTRALNTISIKKRENVIIIIQRWWRRILILFKGIDSKIVLIQSVIRGYLYRKEFYRLFGRENKIKSKKLQRNNYKLFAFYLLKAIQLKIESNKHHLLHILSTNYYAINKKDDHYKKGIDYLHCFCIRFHYKDVIKIFKLQILQRLFQHIELQKEKEYINKWRMNIRQIEESKVNAMRKVLINKLLTNDKETMLICSKSFTHWKVTLLKELSISSDHNIITIINTKLNKEDKGCNTIVLTTQLQLEQEQREKEEQDRQNQLVTLKKQKRTVLSKSVSSLQIRAAFIKKSYFYRWIRKMTIKPKRQVTIKANKQKPSQFYLLKSICRNILEKIKRESNRRKLIKMFYHIRNFQTPTINDAMQKIMIYSNLKLQIINAYATYIQSYYRMKKKQRIIMIQMITTKKIAKTVKTKQKKCNEEYIEQLNNTYNNNSIYQSNVSNSHNKEDIIMTNNQHLNAKEIFDYLSRRLFIKSILYTLMVAC